MFKKVDDKIFCLQQPPPARGRWQRSSCWLEVEDKVEGDYFEKGQVEDQTRGGVGAESCWRLIWTLLHRCSPLASLQFTKVQFRQQHHPIRIVSHCHQRPSSLGVWMTKRNQIRHSWKLQYDICLELFLRDVHIFKSLCSTVLFFPQSSPMFALSKRTAAFSRETFAYSALLIFVLSEKEGRRRRLLQWSMIFVQRRRNRRKIRNKKDFPIGWDTTNEPIWWVHWENVFIVIFHRLPVRKTTFSHLTNPEMCLKDLGPIDLKFWLQA